MTACHVIIAVSAPILQSRFARWPAPANLCTMSKPKTKARKDKAAEALDLYLHTDLTQGRICELVGWSERTFTTHKQKGNWEELKQAETISPKRIIANLYRQAHALSEMDVVDADKLVKLANTIEKLTDRKVTLSHYINVFKDFTTWLIGKDRDLAVKVNEHQQAFIKERVQ